MNIEGTYDITVQTPVGEQKGTLTLERRDDDLIGTLTNVKGSSDFDVKLEGNHGVSFTTRIQTPLGRLKAQVSGEIEDNRFTGTAKLPLGNASIIGARRASEE